MVERIVLAAPDDEIVVMRDDELALVSRDGVGEVSGTEGVGDLVEMARALTVIGNSMAEMSWQLALAPADRAVKIYRKLLRGGVKPPPDLGGALSRLLTFMSEMSTCTPEAGRCAGRRSVDGPAGRPRWRSSAGSSAEGHM